MSQIRYDAAANLEKWPSREAMLKPRNGDSVVSQTVFTGTLAGCVRQFMDKPESRRPLYEIFTDADAAFNKSILDALDIAALAERPDFPAK
jgi:hypothetical protein